MIINLKNNCGVQNGGCGRDIRFFKYFGGHFIFALSRITCTLKGHFEAD